MPKKELWDLNPEITPFLSQLQNGEKLIKSSHYNKHFFGQCPYKIDRSFIKLNGHVVAIEGDKRNRILGKGSFGLVKRAYDNDHTYALKITTDSDITTEEHEILEDLGLLVGHATRENFNPKASAVERKNYDRNKKKHYTLMPYLGTSLDKYLFSHTDLSDEDRLKLAIGLCLKVAKLHSGSLSKTQTSYAHCDIKPANFSLDDQGNLWLLDFGCAIKNAKNKVPDTRGTPIYMPPKTQHIQGEALDILALKRTLFLPKTFVTCNPERRNHKAVVARAQVKHFSPWVLTDKIIKERKLTSYLSTESTTKSGIEQFIPAKKLAAILILALCHLERYYSLLDTASNSQSIIDNVINLYFENKLKTLKKLLNTKLKQHQAPSSVLDGKTYRILDSLNRPKLHRPSIEPYNPLIGSVGSKDQFHALRKKSTTTQALGHPRFFQQNKPIAKCLNAEQIISSVQLPDKLRQFILKNAPLKKLIELTKGNSDAVKPVQHFVQLLMQIESSDRRLYERINQELSNSLNNKASKISPDNILKLKNNINILLFRYTSAKGYSRADWTKFRTQLTDALQKMCKKMIEQGDLVKVNKKETHNRSFLPPLAGL